MQVTLLVIGISSDVQRQPVGNIQLVTQVDIPRIVVGELVVHLVVAVGDSSTEVIVVTCTAHAQVILLVEGVTLGILGHIIEVAVAHRCELIQTALHFALRDVTCIVVGNGLNTL